MGLKSWIRTSWGKGSWRSAASGSVGAASSNSDATAEGRTARSLGALSLGGGSPRLPDAVSVSALSPSSSERFEVLETVGSGSFSTVVLARKRLAPDAGRLFAMKICEKRRDGGPGGGGEGKGRRKAPNSKVEPFILGFLASKDDAGAAFVVELRYAFQDRAAFYLVTDYFAGGSLERGLRAASGGVYAVGRATFYAAELAVALGFLHEHGVAHRDLKPSNVLLDARGHVKVADFGLAKFGVRSDGGCASFCGSVEYMAPEILRGRRYGVAVDWWALGVVLCEMVYGRTPFHDADPRALMRRILREPPRVGDDADAADGRDPRRAAYRWTARALLDKAPRDRLGGRGGADAVRAAPLFAHVDWDAVASRRDAPLDPAVAGRVDAPLDFIEDSDAPYHPPSSPLSPVPPSPPASSPISPASPPPPPADDRRRFFLDEPADRPPPRRRAPASPAASPAASPQDSRRAVYRADAEPDAGRTLSASPRDINDRTLAPSPVGWRPSGPDDGDDDVQIASCGF